MSNSFLRLFEIGKTFRTCLAANHETVHHGSHRCQSIALDSPIGYNMVDLVVADVDAIALDVLNDPDGNIDRDHDRDTHLDLD